MKGILCLVDSANGVATSQLTISTGYIPTKWGLTIPGKGAYSQNDGRLLYLNSNYQNVGTTLNILTPITFPSVGPNMVKAVGTWVIPLLVNIDYNVLIIIRGNPTITTNLPFIFSTGTCAIYFLGVKTTIGCSYTANTY
jgi:hypothetical protein